MFVIVDIQNIVRSIANYAVWVKTQSNGVTVLSSERDSTSIYNQDDDTFWPTKGVIAGQDTYRLFEVEEIPEGCEVDICRYNVGSIELDEELKAVRDEQIAAEKSNEMLLLEQKNAAKIIAEQQTDKAVILSLAHLYDEWDYPVAYKKDKIVSYGVNSDNEPQLYTVIQDHTSQEDWTPDTAVSLYKAIGFDEEGYPIWTQPLGAHDAYALNDIVSHNGEYWQSDYANNVWEPGVFGWHKYEGEV